MSPDFKTVTPDEVAAIVAAKNDIFIVDVREPRDYHAGHIPDAISLPADHFHDRYARELDAEDPIIVVCERGRNSEAAARFLAEQGFTDVATMTGGMTAWTGPTESTR